MKICFYETPPIWNNLLENNIVANTLTKNTVKIRLRMFFHILYLETKNKEMLSPRKTEDKEEKEKQETMPIEEAEHTLKKTNTVKKGA